LFTPSCATVKSFSVYEQTLMLSLVDVLVGIQMKMHKFPKSMSTSIKPASGLQEEQNPAPSAAWVGLAREMCSIRITLTYVSAIYKQIKSVLCTFKFH